MLSLNIQLPHKMKLKIILFIAALNFTFISFAQIPNYVPQNGLKGYWPFACNANDVGVNGYHGTVGGAMLTNDRFGRPSSAYSFNGVSDFISTNYSGVLGSSPRSVSFWMRTSSTIAQPGVSWGGTSTGSRFDCGFNYMASGAGLDVANGAMIFATPVSTTDNNWHHYVFQFSVPTLNQIEVYQDGVLLTQVAFSSLPATTINTTIPANVYFGFYPLAGGFYFSGQLDDIGIWDRVLTNAEILQLYNATASASQSASITITSNFNVLCNNQVATLTASGGTSYQWNTGPNGSSIYVSPTGNTTYTVTGIAENGCSVTAVFTQSVTLCNGVGDVRSESGSKIILHPNPTKGKFSLTGIDAWVAIDVYDSMGNIVWKKVWDETLGIDISHQPKGIYFAKITLENNSVVKKIIKE